MMDPAAIVIVAAIITSAIVGLVFLAVAGDEGPSTKPPPPSRYDTIWEKLDAVAGVKAGRSLNVIAAPRGSGKSQMSVYNQGHRMGYQKGYQEGVDYAIAELCEADGES